MNAFTSVFDKVTTTLAYDPSWANGTGYMDGAVSADLGLRPGQIARGVDEHNRRFVFVGTHEGNIVVFERHSPKTTGERSRVIVSNIPEYISKLLNGVGGIGSALTEEGIRLLIGDEIGVMSTAGSRNFGSRMLRAANVSSRKHRR